LRGERRSGGRLDKYMGSVPALPAILAASLLTRLPGLAARPLWYDEAFAVLFSSKGLGAMLYGTLQVQSGVAADVHPLLYYSLLWIWGDIFGRAPAAVRSFSVLIGLGVVACGYLLAREIFGSRLGLAAGLVLAFSPFQVHYAQEVRMYGLLGMILGSATLVFWKALQDDRWWQWASFGLLGGLAMYTHVLASAYLIALGLTPLLWRRWKALAKAGLSGVLAGMLFSPWMLRLPEQIARVDSSYWVQTPGPAELVRTLLVFVGGLPVPQWALAPLLFCAVLLLVLGGWSTLRASRRGDAGAGLGRWMLYLALAPMVLLFLISYWTPVYIERALLPSGVTFVIWLAWALASGGLPRLMHWTGWAAMAFAFALGLFGFFTYRGFPYAPFAALDRDLERAYQPGDIILHSNKLTAIPAAYYDPELPHQYLADPPGSGSDTLAAATQEILGMIAEPDAADAVGDARRVYFIIFAREEEEYQALGTDAHPALGWLEGRFRMVDAQAWNDLVVYEFDR
jgi:mannosyltransferase